MEHTAIFLTVTAADFITQTGTKYIAQFAPAVSPVHQANATGPQIAETIRQWMEDHRTFKITQEVGQALLSQVIASTLASYLCCHYSSTLGWANVTILDVLITKTGLFPEASRTWCTQDRAYHTMSHFQRDFLAAESEQRLTTTTKSAGYHGVNIAEGYYQTNTLATTDPSFAIAVTAEVTRLMANATISLEKSNNSNITQEQPNANGMIYCHTHGASCNAKHTSTTCKRPGQNNKTATTMAKNMGGNTKVFTNQDIRWQGHPKQTTNALEIEEIEWLIGTSPV